MVFTYKDTFILSKFSYFTVYFAIHCLNIDHPLYATERPGASYESLLYVIYKKKVFVEKSAKFIKRYLFIIEAPSIVSVPRFAIFKFSVIGL